jgi:hypothetical protein
MVCLYILLSNNLTRTGYFKSQLRQADGKADGGYGALGGIWTGTVRWTVFGGRQT